MGKICPHCKSELPEESSFCPHCARSLVHPRPLRLPWHISLRFLAAVLILVLAAGAAGILHIQNLPKTYEGLGELTYTDSHGSYQLLLSTSQSDRYSPPTNI